MHISQSHEYYYFVYGGWKNEETEDIQQKYSFDDLFTLKTQRGSVITQNFVLSLENLHIFGALPKFFERVNNNIIL